MPANVGKPETLNTLYIFNLPAILNTSYIPDILSIHDMHHILYIPGNFDFLKILQIVEKLWGGVKLPQKDTARCQIAS